MLQCQTITVDHTRLYLETVFIHNGKGESKTQNSFLFLFLCRQVIQSFGICMSSFHANGVSGTIFRSILCVAMVYNRLSLLFWCTPPSNSVFKTLHFWCRHNHFYLLPFFTQLDFGCTCTCLITPSNSSKDTPHSGNTCQTRMVPALFVCKGWDMAWDILT